MKKSVHLLPHSRQRQRGAVAIIVGLCIVVLIGMIGLVVDLGHMFITKTELQNAADACALAAARELDGGSDALVRAENVGLTVGQRNNVDLQATAVSIVANDISFSATLSPNSGYLTRSAGANPTTSKYAMCTLNRSGIAMWFMQVLGTGDQAVGAQAVATVAPSQTTCAIPIGICEQGSAPTFGFTLGQWYSGKFDSSAPGGTGSYNWLDFSPNSGGGADELKDLLKGAGQCELPPIGALVGQQGQISGLSDAWNSRFGVYKNGGQYNTTTSPPDFTGLGYTNTTLMTFATATTWDPPQNAYSGTSTTGTSNYLAGQTARTPYQNTDPADIGNAYNPSSSANHSQYGANRRIAIAPVVDCQDLASSNPQPIPILGYACVLMLNPIKGPDDVFLEFRGMANDASSPCASYGIPGGAAGPLVPVLVQ
ncbi:MAG: hypothetical protein H6R07_1364 [Proteobacteria bacterium]|nr:hypothetical protein [Pseudomonadota bacterium]